MKRTLKLSFNGRYNFYNPYLEKEKHSLKSLAHRILNQPPGPEKIGDYFIRCRSKYRNNDLCENPNLLISDGDSSTDNLNRAPNPKHVHKAMKAEGFNHLIVPSFSNGMKLDDGSRKRKWRLLVPCEGVTRETLTAHTDCLHWLLQQHGIKINPARESKVLSQAWFITRPDAGKFHNWALIYTKGSTWVVDAVEQQLQLDLSIPEHAVKVLPRNSNGTRTTCGYVSYADALQNLKTGHNLHGTIYRLCKTAIDDGHAPNDVKEALLDEFAKNNLEAVRGYNRIKVTSKEIDRTMKKLI